MAVTTETYSAAAGWSRSDVITLLESGFTFAGMHGGPIAGITSTVKTHFGGGTVGSSSTVYYDVPVATTSGIGTGATFNVQRSSGNIADIKVNKVGYNYAESENVTLDPQHIGGTQNSATTATAIVGVMGQGSPESFGTTSTFFRKQMLSSYDSNRPWGALRQVRDQGKIYGTTYRAFKIHDDYRMNVLVGPSLSANEDDQTSGYGMYGDSFRGTEQLDVTNSYGDRLDTDANTTAQVNNNDNFQYATSSSPTTHGLNLNVYRSSIDPNFAVFSWQQPSIDGTLTDSTFSTFIVHNFDSSLWDYDEVFTAGHTFITPSSVANTSQASSIGLSFNTILSGNKYQTYQNICTRSAESGYIQIYNTSHRGTPYVSTRYVSTSSDNQNSAQGDGYGYSQNSQYNDTRIFTRVGGFKDGGRIVNDYSDPNYNNGNHHPITHRKSVIKGIPINAGLVPNPYYIPDDFCIIDMTLDQSEQNIRQGDTITVSGSEIYKVITGGYNKYEQTSGMFFCARVA
jgi:hypothetical protein